jgi:Skp family chaperone for outer membrane proteins
MKGMMMRHTLLVTAVFITGALAVGCTSKDRKPAVASKPGETAAAHLDRAKAETKEAAQAMRDYAYAEKTEFADKMKKELVSIQEELDRLGAKVDRASGAAKADAKVKLETVREKWAQAKKQLDQAESATESSWDDVKNGFKQSYVDLKDSFAKTRQWLSDKIAP